MGYSPWGHKSQTQLSDKSYVVYNVKQLLQLNPMQK